MHVIYLLEEFWLSCLVVTAQICLRTDDVPELFLELLQLHLERFLSIEGLVLASVVFGVIFNFGGASVKFRLAYSNLL